MASTELRDFLVSLYGTEPLPAGVTLMVRAVHPSGALPSFSEFYTSIDALVADREKLDEWNAADGGRSIFFGVAPRNGRQGDKAHCYGITALWAELDAKMFIPHDGDAATIQVGQGVIDKMVAGFPIPPTVIVNSGGGQQLYWHLSTTYARRDTKRDPEWDKFVARIEGLLHGIQPMLQSDPSRTNFDSLMRLPTFFNPKYAHKPVATVVRSEPTPAALAWFKKFEPATAPEREPVERKDGEWPVLAAFKERDLYIDQHAESEHRVDCPWKSEHTTDSGDRQTLLYEPSDDNQQAGGFKCLHGHCATRGIRDVYTFFGLSSIAPVEVVDLSEVDLDAFPDELVLPDRAYIGLGREFADVYSSAFEAPRVFWYHAFLSHFGAWISRHTVMTGSLGTTPRLNAVLIGTSGWTRKSTAIRETEKFFKVYRELFFNVYPKEDARRYAGTLTVDKGTGSAEALARKWSASPDRPVLLQLDELSSLMAKARQEGQQLLQFIAGVIEHGSFSNDTLTYRVEVDNVELSLLAACTSSTFQSVFNARELNIGLLNRLWLVPGQSARDRFIDVPDVGDITPLARKVGERMQAMREVAASEPGGRLQFELSKDARERWREWYRAFRQSAREAEHLARVDTHAMGLAVLLAASTPDGAPLIRSMSTPINLPVMEAVLAMVEWQIAARGAYQPVASESGAGALEGRIRSVLSRHAGKWVTHSMLYKLSNAGRGSGGGLVNFNRVMDAMRSAREVERDERTGANKRRLFVYRLAEGGN